MQSNQPLNPWRLSVAPMMDWTDRHCRVFHRLLTRHTRLYTEMVSTGALLHGDVARHLDFSAQEHPLALQLGGSEPADLAHCARLAQDWGYDEVNLNCGCPSERVQRGSFGACLMAEPMLVGDCVAAMREACDLPVTVKHRIGIDRNGNDRNGSDRDDSYDFVRDFVGTVAERGGASVFIVHARSAWLKGLSPKENREVPPLRYEMVYRLKQDFPALTIVLNGGVKDDQHLVQHLAQVDGVMLGRQAYHEPWWMSGWDAGFWRDAAAPQKERDEIEESMVRYMEQLAASGQPWGHAARHIVGLRNGQAGARRWRQAWSDAALRRGSPRAAMAAARAAQAAVGAGQAHMQNAAIVA